MGLFDAAPQLDGPITIRPIERATWEPWLRQYHYSGTGPSGATYYGVFRPDLAAVVGVGPTTNIHGLTNKYGLTDWVGNLEIVRVACHPDAPKMMASQAVAAVLKILADQGVDWVFSYADTGQNHHGGIYQALNAVYVGLNKPEAGSGYRIDGKLVHPRTVVAKYGSQSKARMQELRDEGHEVVMVEGVITPKHTYILPITRSKWLNKKIRQHLAQYQQPYPKRSAA